MSHRLVRDIQTALGEQIFDVAIAECESDIQPNRVPDDRGRKLVAGKVNAKKTRIARLPEESFDFLGYTVGRFHGKNGRP